MYLALYRKYRPSTFDDVISQEHITTTLKKQIVGGQIAHAYLFTGTRGTGKTSCAKIMAKAVNCLSPVNGNPCGECKSCRAIAEGSTDIIEIDAASNNGVDNIRQIRDEVIYTPIDCKYKVYIIDEVHMLSDSAFNALLKTLEEPPEHAIFILATTEYYKVPATILSRCQQFLFSKIDPEAAKKRLLEGAEKENITLTENAAALIARLSDGAMRDAWSLLDQCISTSSTVDEETVRRCSGVADSGYLFAISEAVIAQKPADALKLLDDLITAGKDLSRLIEELTQHYRNIMLMKAVDGSFVKGTDEDLKRYKEQCGSLSLEEIMRQVDLLSNSLDNINRMKQTGQARLLTEQLLIRLCLPKLATDNSSLSARIGALENRMNNFSFDVQKSSVAEIEKRAVSEPRVVENPIRTDNKTSEEKAVSEPKSDSGAAPQNDFPFDIDDEIPLPTVPTIADDGFADYSRTESGFAANNLPAASTAKITPKTETKTEQQQKEEKPPDENRINSPQEKEKQQDETEIRPIPESDMELPDNLEQLPQWSEILALLPAASKNILKSAKAYLYDGQMFVDAPTAAFSMMKSGKRASKLREAVKTVLGGRFEIFTLPEKKRSEEEKEDKVTPFLDRARELGIDVTVKEK